MDEDEIHQCQVPPLPDPPMVRQRKLDALIWHCPDCGRKWKVDGYRASYDFAKPWEGEKTVGGEWVKA